jgi:hypothetical protein
VTERVELNWLAASVGSATRLGDRLCLLGGELIDPLAQAAVSPHHGLLLPVQCD